MTKACSSFQFSHMKLNQPCPEFKDKNPVKKFTGSAFAEQIT